MAESTIAGLEDMVTTRERWLESAEDVLNRVQPQRDALVHELIAERERKGVMRKNWSESIARYQEQIDANSTQKSAEYMACYNEREKFRFELIRAINERNAIVGKMGIPESSDQAFVLDHIDYLNNACRGYARLQDIADGYRGTLRKIKDAIEQDNWPDCCADDWYGRMAWIVEEVDGAINGCGGNE